MYIIISLFFVYAAGVISYELNIFFYVFLPVFLLLAYNSYITKKYIYNAVIISFVILSFINCYYNSISKLSDYVNEEVEATVKIKNKNINKTSAGYISYNAVVLGINNELLHNEENTILYADSKLNIEENSIIKVSVSVGDNSQNKNKMMFNYKNYLRAKKIGAVIFAKNDFYTAERGYSVFGKISIDFRNKAEHIFYSRLDKNNADIILSILLGNVDYLEDNFYENVKQMGMAHIFAVSGTHIVILYAFLLHILKYIFLERKKRLIITWCLIWFYGFLIGFPVSVMRTLVMFTIIFGADIFYKKYSSLNSIGLAALSLTVYNPFWLFDAGFLLSFSAALSLIVFNKYIQNVNKTNNHILRSIYLYIFLMLFTLPVLAYFFNYIPIMGILYNLILLPVFSFIIICGFILLLFASIVPSLLVIPFKIYNFMLFGLRYIVSLTENIAYNGVIIRTLSVSEVVFYYMVIILAIYFYNNQMSPVKKLSIYAIVLFYIVTFAAVPIMYDLLCINIADAGQGLFTHINYKNMNIIIDCGSTGNKDFGKYIAVPYLIKRGVSNVDIVFISHWDSDHYSGIKDILKSDICIDNIFAPDETDVIQRSVDVIYKGMSARIGEKLNIKLLWPEENFTLNKINNTSLVILMEYGDKNILFTGDIESEVERIIMDDIPKTDILIVPHHGSATSSTDMFVQNARPEIAVFSYGKNTYGIPSNEVLERYKNVKSTNLSTFEQGEINLLLNGDKIYYNTYTGLKSKNYYELYFLGFTYKLGVFCLLLLYIITIQGEKNELQNYI